MTSEYCGHLVLHKNKKINPTQNQTKNTGLRLKSARHARYGQEEDQRIDLEQKTRARQYLIVAKGIEQPDNGLPEGIARFGHVK